MWLSTYVSTLIKNVHIIFSCFCKTYKAYTIFSFLKKSLHNWSVLQISQFSKLSNKFCEIFLFSFFVKKKKMKGKEYEAVPRSRSLNWCEWSLAHRCTLICEIKTIIRKQTIQYSLEAYKKVYLLVQLTNYQSSQTLLWSLPFLLTPISGTCYWPIICDGRLIGNKPYFSGISTNKLTQPLSASESFICLL